MTSKVSSSFINQLVKTQQLLWELSRHFPSSLLFYFILFILCCFVFFLFVSSPRANLSLRKVVSETGAPRLASFLFSNRHGHLIHFCLRSIRVTLWKYDKVTSFGVFGVIGLLTLSALFLLSMVIGRNHCWDSHPNHCLQSMFSTSIWTKPRGFIT